MAANNQIKVYLCLDLFLVNNNKNTNYVLV